MTALISGRSLANLMSFEHQKKLAFLLFLLERLLPDLYSFYSSIDRNPDVYLTTQRLFWEHLSGKEFRKGWTHVRDDLLRSAPDSEEYGSLRSTLALNAALVAAEIAAFLEDGDDGHILDSLKYTRDSLDAFITTQRGTFVYTPEDDEYVDTHPLTLRERQVEERDVEFLSTLGNQMNNQAIYDSVKQRAHRQVQLLQDRPGETEIDKIQ